MFIVNNKKKQKQKQKQKGKKEKEKKRKGKSCAHAYSWVIVLFGRVPGSILRHFYMYIVKATLKFQTAVGYNFIMLCNRIIIIIIIRHAKNAVLPLFEISLGRVRQEIPLSQN